MQGLPVISEATCAEVTAGPDKKTYKVTGVVSNISNTVYGNWDIVDATGKVLRLWNFWTPKAIRRILPAWVWKKAMRGNNTRSQKPPHYGWRLVDLLCSRLTNRSSRSTLSTMMYFRLRVVSLRHTSLTKRQRFCRNSEDAKRMVVYCLYRPERNRCLREVPSCPKRKVVTVQPALHSALLTVKRVHKQDWTLTAGRHRWSYCCWIHCRRGWVLHNTALVV